MYKRDSPYGVIWASNTQNAGKGPYQFFLWVSCDKCEGRIQCGKDNLVSWPIDTGRYAYINGGLSYKDGASICLLEHIFIIFTKMSWHTKQT